MVRKINLQVQKQFEINEKPKSTELKLEYGCKFTPDFG